MAKDTKINMPSSMGGITRFYDESSSKIRMSPMVVVWLILAAILVLGILLPLIRVGA